MPIKRINIENQFQCIGKILRPQGVKGELKMQNFSDIAGRYQSLDYIYIGPTAKLSIPYKVADLKETRGYIYLRLQLGDSIEDVEHLAGLFCFVPENALPGLPEDRFYIKDLVGMQVYDVGKEHVGIVHDVLQNPANDVLVVRTGEQEYFIPMVDEFVKKIDVDDQQIIIKLIEGLGGYTDAH